MQLIYLCESSTSITTERNNKRATCALTAGPQGCHVHAMRARVCVVGCVHVRCAEGGICPKYANVVSARATVRHSNKRSANEKSAAHSQNPCGRNEKSCTGGSANSTCAQTHAHTHTHTHAHSTSPTCTVSRGRETGAHHHTRTPPRRSSATTPTQLFQHSQISHYGERTAQARELRAGVEDLMRCTAQHSNTHHLRGGG